MSIKPTVLVFSPEYPPNVCGGLGTHVDCMTDALAPNFNFHVVTEGGFHYSPSTSRIQVHAITVPRTNDFALYWETFCHKAVSYVEELGLEFDYIQCHDWMTVLAGVMLRAKQAKPLVFNIHLPQAAGACKVIEQLGLLAADHVIVNSRAVFEEIRANDPTSASLSVIRNGVDLQRFCPAPHWPSDEGYFLYVGRLVPQKGVGTLLLALAVLLHRKPVRLVIVGDGHLELFLRRAVRSLGISQSVTFVGWSTGEELVRWYQASRVVVVPSLYEPFGIVALEAMACGRPVVASTTGGLAEIVDDGITGYLVGVGDHLSLAARMMALTADEERYREMATASRTRAESFTWASAASETTAILRSLACKPWSTERWDAIRSCARDISTMLKIPCGPVLPSLLTGVFRCEQ